MPYKDIDSQCIVNQINAITSEGVALEHFQLYKKQKLEDGVMITYRWKFLVRQILVTDLVDLRVENRHDLFRTHHIYLETQICYLVKIRATNRCLDER